MGKCAKVEEQSRQFGQMRLGGTDKAKRGEGCSNLMLTSKYLTGLAFDFKSSENFLILIS